MPYTRDKTPFCLPVNQTCFYIAVLYFVLYLGGCHPVVAKNKDHSAKCDEIIRQTDSIRAAQGESSIALHGESAMAHLDSVYGVFADAGPIDLFRKYQYKWWYYNGIRHDYAKAILCIDSAITLFQKTLPTVEPGSPWQRQIQEQYAQALFFKGDALLSQKKYDESFLFYSEAKQICEKIGDICSIADYSGRLGTACYRLGRYREGAVYFRKAYEETNACEKQKDPFLVFAAQQGTLDNIAICYQGAGMKDSAIYFFDSVLSYIRLREKEFGRTAQNISFMAAARGVVYGNKADIYYQLGNTDSAEALYTKSIDLNLRKDREYSDAQVTLAKLTRLYLGRGRFEAARRTLDRYGKSLDSFPVADNRLTWLQLNWKYFDTLRRPLEAYPYLQGYLKLKDSLDAGVGKKDVSGMLERIQHKYDLELLKKKDETTSIYLNIAIVFSIMALVIIIQVWINWKRSRKNLTELTQLHERILRQNDHMQEALTALEQSQRDNTRIMKVVAHDLRNPVGSIGTIVSLLLKKDIPSDQRQMLELVWSSSQSSLELINDLLYTNTTAGEMSTEPVDMEVTLRYCVELLQFKAEVKRQRILLQTKSISVWADREKIWRVVSNLVTNAIKFSPTGTDILVGLDTEDGKLRIWVKDHGIGIPDELKENLFDLFTSAKRKGTAGEESFGLGLSISRQIVEAHGGRIWCESAAGRGTTFHIELPLERA